MSEPFRTYANGAAEGYTTGETDGAGDTPPAVAADGLRRLLRRVRRLERRLHRPAIVNYNHIHVAPAALSGPAHAAPPQEIRRTPEAPSEAGVCPGPGFRSVRHGGRLYGFTEMQARAVKALYDAWAAGTPDVPDEDLLRAAGTESVKLGDVFRDSDAWNTLVVGGASRGTHRLAPESAEGEGGAR